MAENSMTGAGGGVVQVMRYEWEALYDWHREQQYESARRERYSEADEHKTRADKIRKMLDTPS